MNNVLKHSNARFVNISLRSDPFEMAISDDGQGFARNGNSGYGLSGMAGRAESIGYALAIESVPGTGTIIRITKKR